MTKRRDILWLVLIIAVGLGTRIALAPSEGHGGDLGINKGWAKSAVQIGVARSYREQLDGNMLPNYPPLSMLIFAGTGHLYRLIVSPSYDASLPAYHIFIKLPGIIGDVLLSVLLLILVRRHRGRRAGIAVGLLYAIHPAAIYDSAVWGQTDALHTLFMVVAIAGFSREHPALGTASYVLALLTKMQAIAIAPLIVLLLLTSGDWRTILRSLLAGSCAAIAILLFFGAEGTLTDVLQIYPHSLGYYSALSMGAYNLWNSAFNEIAGASDTDLLVLGMNFRQIGIALFFTASICILALMHPLLRRRPGKGRDATMVLLAGSLLSYAFFLFPTEMHERYLFPFVALGLPAIFLGLPSALLYVLASIGFLLNLLGSLSWSNLDRQLFAGAPHLGIAIGYAHVAFFFLMLFTIWLLCRPRIPSSIPRP